MIKRFLREPLLHFSVAGGRAVCGSWDSIARRRRRAGQDRR